MGTSRAKFNKSMEAEISRVVKATNIYRIQYHKDIEKILLKLPPKICENFRDAVFTLQQNPFPPHPKIKKLHRPLEGYRYRLHPYRVTYTINTATKTVYIYDFFHRGRGY